MFAKHWTTIGFQTILDVTNPAHEPAGENNLLVSKSAHTSFFLLEATVKLSSSLQLFPPFTSLYAKLSIFNVPYIVSKKENKHISQNVEPLTLDCSSDLYTSD